MKAIHTFLGLLTAASLLISCKDKEVTTSTEERIEENHPTEANPTGNQSADTATVLKDSLIDNNMKGQSDTHGKDTDAGK